MKKKRWKWFAVLVGAVLAIGGTIAGTSTGESSKKIYGNEPVELSFFLRKRETTHIFETIIERFNQSQDEIVVKTLLCRIRMWSWRCVRSMESFPILLR